MAEEHGGGGEGEVELIKGVDGDQEKNPAVHVGYGDKGFEFGTGDGNFLLQLQTRFQFRYAYPVNDNPVSAADFEANAQNVFTINRARLKVGGHGYRPWLRYFFEYELASNALLDYRLMVEGLPFLRFKAGQWKVHYSRERVISSGTQQMMDRSIVNRPFTVDRQQGVSLYGHLKGAGAANFNYWASVFTGTGRGAGANDDTYPMLMFRGQWNFLGRELAFSGSDLAYHRSGAGLLALAAVTNQSPYTRFSQDGGGQLEGFKEGESGQYRVNQAMAETALKYRGFAWQQELHWKHIDDRKNGEITTLIGNYVQFGYFFHHAWSAIPKSLELAFRHAFYDPDVDAQNDLQQEFALVANWFFKGHLNKLSAELTYFHYRYPAPGSQDMLRFRVQWDISI
jgi:phosphate-selective porin